MRTRMFHDPFGRPALAKFTRCFAWAAAAWIAGSVCPPRARSETPPLDTNVRRASYQP